MKLFLGVEITSDSVHEKTKEVALILFAVTHR